MCLYETINSSQTNAELNLEQPIPHELPYSGKLLQISHIRKSFLCEIWGVASFGVAKVSNS